MPEIDAPPPAPNPSPGTAAWVAWRDAARKAAAADRIRAEDERAARDEREPDRPDGRRAVLIGLAVVGVVLVLSLLVIRQMSCDPLYSDRGLSRRSACQ